jgi:hypothetical protein
MSKTNPRPMPEPALMTVTATRALFGNTPRSTFYRHLYSRLQIVKIGGKPMVVVESAHALLAQLRAEAA